MNSHLLWFNIQSQPLLLKSLTKWISCLHSTTITVRIPLTSNYPHKLFLYTHIQDFSIEGCLWSLSFIYLLFNNNSTSLSEILLLLFNMRKQWLGFISLLLLMQIEGAFCLDVIPPLLRQIIHEILTWIGFYKLVAYYWSLFTTFGMAIGVLVGVVMIFVSWAVFSLTAFALLMLGSGNIFSSFRIC